MVKRRVCYLPFKWTGGKEKESCYGLLFLHNKSKRSKSEEQGLCPIP